VSVKGFTHHSLGEGGPVIIIGAGPAGLGAAWRLHERGHTNWTLFEASNNPGGLASSVLDANGFTWDLGGHVLFSHYPYFDDVMVQALGDAWVEHVREAWVWMRDRWIPYPFQNNIRRLPPAELAACLRGLEQLQGRQASKPATFREWLLGSFGAGICDSFLFPYNKKVWAYDPSKLNVEWMGERVATVDLQRIRRNIELQQDDVSWGPNSTFRFPLHGGTGAIWREVAKQLPADRLRFGRRIAAVDVSHRRVAFDDGETIGYERLISTMPLDELLSVTYGRPELAAAAPRFVYSSSHIIGIGLQGSPPDDLRTKCWIYFPEPDVPFYRATVFSNYSPNNAPAGHWSLMAEVSESSDKPVNAGTVVDEVVAAFQKCGFIDSANVVSRWHQRLEHGYPTPWLGRDAVLQEVDRGLRDCGIFSRGRFGAWKYEVSNQDHSFMQGVEAVDHVITGAAEHTYHGDMSGGHVTSARPT
jgi:protoporphyrinogen oxidase